jgi:glycerol uptake facilitator-like aquaporin
MKMEDRQAIAAELLGSVFLTAAVVGSGIMGERLANGNTAVALLANSIATGAILMVLIQMFGPVSGAHFNPVVTALIGYQERHPVIKVLKLTVAQFSGALAGVGCANLMFGLPPFFFSTHVRAGGAQLFSESFGTFGLLLVIFVCGAFRRAAIPYAVAGYITAGYWFTGSTCFANPSVTFARAFTNTFSGIRPGDVPLFIVAQLGGGVLAAASFWWMTKGPAENAGFRTSADAKKGTV